MQALVCGCYRASVVRSDAEMDSVLALRAQVFRAGADDRDRFDTLCDHIAVTDVSTDRIVATARVMVLASGAQIDMSYAAQSYDLLEVSRFNSPLLELGRFCLAAGHGDADILRAIWGLLTRLVDHHRVRFLFGCSSFPGVDLADKATALAYLAAHHPAPFAVTSKADVEQCVALADIVGTDNGRALHDIPPLLRTYLSMGAWVGDHAVIDEDLGTVHVFTGLEIDAIPTGRKKLLRRLAGVDAASLGA